MPARQTLDVGLLRSIMRMGTEPDADLLHNLESLRVEVVPIGIDAHLLKYIGHQSDTSGRVPDFSVVYSYYDHLKATDSQGMPGLIRLMEVQQAALPFWPKNEFRLHLDRYKEEVIGDTLGDLLQQTSTVLTTGYTPIVAKGKAIPLKGASDALNFIETGISQLQTRFRSGSVEGSFRVDAANVWAQYQARKGKSVVGVLSGFTEIDSVHDGLLPGDLALMLGFTGQFKSTICFNWAYHAAVLYGKNVALLSMEMSARTLLNMLAVIHCYHRRFEQKYTMNDITYDRFRRGLLTDGEEKLMQESLDDLQHNPDYGQMIYMEPDRALTVSDVRRWAETQHRRLGLDLLVIDYLGLVNPSGGGSSLRESANLNAAIAEAKKMATTFDNGKGIAVLSPFQSNRDGFKEAEKAGGRYNLRALAWANEAERSSDFVYSTFIDDALRNSSRLRLGNLKARDRELITELVEVFCDPKTRVVQDPDGTRLNQTPSVAVYSTGSVSRP